MKHGITLLLFFIISIVNAVGQEDCENRANIYDFTSAERSELAQLILDYVTSIENPDWDSNDPIETKYTIIHEHTQFGDMQQSQINHTNEEFLSWHRFYISGLEAYLVDKGYPQYVPLPYWNPTQPMPTEFYNVMIQEYIDDGLDTAPLDPFFISDPSATWPSQYDIADDLCSEFTDADDMGNTLVGDAMHSSVHWDVGGALRSQAATSGAAIFWPLHANIDRFYRCYQLNCQCPTTDVVGFADNCDYCLDLSGSILADDFEFTLIDAQGNEQTITLNGEGCIPYQLMNQGEHYTLKIKGINTAMEDNIECPDAEIEHMFTAPYVPSNKWNPNPCLKIHTLPNFPMNYVMFTNNGDGTLLNITNTNVNTGATTLVGSGVPIAENQSINVMVPFSSLPTGVYYLSVQFEGEQTGFEYFIP